MRKHSHWCLAFILLLTTPLLFGPELASAIQVQLPHIDTPLVGGPTSFIKLAQKHGMDTQIVRVSYEFDNAKQHFVRVVHPASVGEVHSAELLAPFDEDMLRQHKYLVVSAKGMPWRDVADGTYDEVFSHVFDSLVSSSRRAGVDMVFFSFNHEPGSYINGSASEYTAAWRHLYSLAERGGLNVGQPQGALVWTWITTVSSVSRAAFLNRGLANSSSKTVADALWPGSEYVNAIGFDGYNGAGCQTNQYDVTRKWRSPSQVFKKALDWAGKKKPSAPILITEWGSAPGVGAENRSRYIKEMGALINSNSNIIAALYWNYRGSGSCHFSITDDRDAINSMKEMMKIIRGRPKSSRY